MKNPGLMFHTIGSLFFFSLFSTSLHAITVNRLNGGANVVYVDFSIPGPVVPLELARTYNSITAVTEANGWNGAFGWGWTAPFETTLTTTPERSVLLRDGVSGNTIAFRPEKEDPAVRDAFMEKMRRAYFEKQLNRKLTDKDLARLRLPDKIVTRLKSDPQFRVELASKFNVKGTIPRGELLISSEFGYQTLQFKDNQWTREKDGIIQYFDKEGRLIRQRDKNGFYFDFKYSSASKQLSEIAAQDKTTTLKLVWRGDRIQEVIDNKNHRAKYTYDALGNLILVIDGVGQNYAYKYENKKFPHLLTRVDYLSESKENDKVYREIRYDENALAIFHREKDGSETTYSYGKKPNDPENNFWTKMVHKPLKGATEEQYDEYFVKLRPDGTKYLYKQEMKLNGSTTVTLFAACCSKPTQIIRNGEITNFKYYDNGLLSERVSAKEDIRLEYDMRWKKVTKVVQNGVTSSYEYDDRGNLTKAENSRSAKVTLKYDRLGRISDMTDPEGKSISFKYGDLGKPTVISEKGVGTIRIAYDSVGKVIKTETLLSRDKTGRKPSEAMSQEVVQRVMRSFQQFLDIIRPAGVNLLNG